MSEKSPSCNYVCRLVSASELSRLKRLARSFDSCLRRSRCRRASAAERRSTIAGLRDKEWEEEVEVVRMDDDSSLGVGDNDVLFGNVEFPTGTELVSIVSELNSTRSLCTVRSDCLSNRSTEKGGLSCCNCTAKLI